MSRILKHILVFLTTFILGLVVFYLPDYISRSNSLVIVSAPINPLEVTDSTKVDISQAEPTEPSPCNEPNPFKKYRDKAVATRSFGIVNWRVECGPLPEYHADSYRKPETVSIFVLIDEYGEVQRSEIISRKSKFAQAALKSAAQTRFAPALLGGQPIRQLGVLIYQFDPSRGVWLDESKKAR